MVSRRLLMPLVAGAAFAEDVRDFCIVGAGPGGLQMAYYFQEAGWDFEVLERGPEVSQFFAKYPRHRGLISVNKRATGRSDPEYNLRHDWHSLLSDGVKHEKDSRLLFAPGGWSEKFYPHADELVEYLKFWANFTGVQKHIRFNTKVTKVTHVPAPKGYVPKGMTSDGKKAVYKVDDAAGGRRLCGVLVVATGFSAEFEPPPGTDKGLQSGDPPLTVPYGSHDTNVSNYFNKTVLLIGMGNAAFETAKHLMPHTAYIHLASRRGAPRWAWETHYVGGLRAVNDLVVDNYQLKTHDVLRQIGEVGTKTVFVKEEGTDRVCADHAQREDMHKQLDAGAIPESTMIEGHSLSLPDRLRSAKRDCYDVVITCMGFRLDDSIFKFKKELKKSYKGKFPELTPQFESKPHPNLFFTGALGHGQDFRASSGGFVHGFRYMARAVFRLMERRFAPKPPPMPMLQWWRGGYEVPPTAAAISEALWKRIDVCSGCYQMFGVLGDAVVLPPAGTNMNAVLLEEVPLNVLPKLVGNDARVVFWLFKYAEGWSGHETVFGDDRVTHNFDPERADESKFLHPVVMYFKDLNKKTKPVTKHFLEDPYTDFAANDDRHKIIYDRPMREFLSKLIDEKTQSCKTAQCKSF